MATDARPLTPPRYNAAVIEQLHKMARESHEKIVGRVAHTHLAKLDRLQARTLHGEPFGHRRVRNQFDDLDSDDEAEVRANEAEGEEEATEEATEGATEGAKE